MTAAPMSRASGRGGGCVLRASGRPVHLDRYPLWGGSRVDQLKRRVRTGVGEQPRALADDHGADEQGDLVDKLVLEQPADQSAAAVHLQLTLPLGFQLADGDRKSTRLNSSHVRISYAVFCLKKKKEKRKEVLTCNI